MKAINLTDNSNDTLIPKALKERKRKVNWNKSEINALGSGYIENFAILEGKFTPKMTAITKIMT